MMAHFFFALFLISLAGFGMVRINTILTYFQQEEYDSSRFMGAVFRVRLYDVLATLGLIALFLAQHFIGLGPYVWLIAAGLLTVIALRERGYSYKKKLVATERLKRIRRLARGFYLLSLGLVIVHAYAALVVWVIYETVQNGRWLNLIAIPAGICVGVSFGFPLYLFLRSRPQE